MRLRFVPSFAPILVLALASGLYAAPPTAEAGDPQFAECVGGVGSFTLSGSGQDPDDDPLTFTWTGPFGSVVGQTVQVDVPLGNNLITLEVDDGNGGTAQDTTNLIVIDTTPPAVGVALNPSLLVPPDGSFRNITANVIVQDACDLGASFTLHSITSNEPDTQIVVNADYGTADTQFILGALLTDVGRQARTYNVFYEGMDTAGNTAIGSGEVLVAAEGLLNISPSRLIFRYTVDDDPPPSQPFTITSIATGSYFEISSNQPWASASPAAGYVSGNVDVSVDPTGLAPGTHAARLTVTSEYGPSATVRVQLYIRDQPELFTMPDELTFEHDVSVLGSGVKAQSAPQMKEVFVGSLNAQAPFSVTTDAPWLSATSSGVSPARITVGASGDGMELGEYAGNVMITPDNPERGSATVPVSLSVIASAGVQVPSYLVNAALMEHRPLAPGSLVTGFWDNPFAKEAAASGLPLPTTLGGLSATIDGLPVRFSYVSRRQFNAQLPMDLWAGVSHMELSFDGEVVGTVPVQILPASPAIFHAGPNALALNPDGSLNGPDNPAPRDSGVALYLTGQGQTDPLVAAGMPAPANPFATPVHPLHLVIDGQTHQPLFAGLAPGQAGLLQVNVPTAALGPGAHVVVISIHSIPSNGVKIYVQ